VGDTIYLHAQTHQAVAVQAELLPGVPQVLLAGREKGRQEARRGRLPVPAERHRQGHEGAL